MAVIKCKMCGGDLAIAENVTVAECEYCGTKQTVPVVDDEKKIKLYERANKLRINCEFDKAAGVYENIVSDYEDEAEGYWGLILCRYGIEYVDDPITGKKVPTCHRSSFDSIMNDSDFEMVMENSDAVSRLVYREEAKYIEEIRKGIIEVSGKEEPYDIFICYKETDENGDRTLDSVLAQDVYDALTEKGYRVFFSRVTLEDKLGVEYEPYIFAALNSAKIMLAFGTSYDHYNAVWVKNEWSRYLKLMAQDKSKHLIPCFKNVDAYDIPKEFAKLQAQDLGKVGATQDLLRGIQKIFMPVNQTGKVVEKETIIVNEKAANAAPLLKRVFLFLEDGDWESADEYCEKVLDVDPENALAYLGKLMADCEVCTKEELRDCAETFDDEGNYQKIERFGTQELINELQEYNEYIRERNETARLEGIYCDAVEKMRVADSENGYKVAADIFATILTYKDSAMLKEECEKAGLEKKEEIYQKARQVQALGSEGVHCKYAAELYASIGDYKDASDLYKECLENAEVAQHKDQYYTPAKMHMYNNTLREYERALSLFEKIPGWRDVDKQVEICRQKIEELKLVEEKRLAEYEQQEAIDRKERKRRTIIIAVVIAIALCLVLGLEVIRFNNINNKYNDAVSLMEAGKYEEAIKAFEALDGHKDSENKILECKYNDAVSLMEAGKLDEAYSIFQELGNYKDAADKASNIQLIKAEEQLKNAKVGDYIKFGVYEQDNNTSNGKEDIEWLVLDKKDGKILVISKYALDCKPYNTSYTDVTWATCTLRTWLNTTFIDSAFTADEAVRMSTITVSADMNPDYSNDPGKATQDRIFLLSITEANNYFSSRIARQCEATDYAVANGADVDKYGNNYSRWWLRTPGHNQGRAACVRIDGTIDTAGQKVGDYQISGLVFRAETAVRPAIWIDLNP